MRRGVKTRWLPGLLVLGLVLSEGGLHVWAQDEQLVVREIELRGLRRNDPELIRAQMQTRQGQPFVREALEEDIRRLYATGLFEEIKKREEAVEGGVRVILFFRENEIIQDLVFVGLKEFRRQELVPDLQLQIGDTLSDYFLLADAERIRDRYLEQGYLFSDVQGKVRPTPGGVIIEYLVREGPRVEVEAVVITGNRQMEEGELRDVMKTDTGWFLSASYLNLRDLQDDLERIKIFYRSEGYLDAEAMLEDLVYNEDRDEAYVTVHVEEGLRYRIQTVKVDGNTLFESEDLLKDLRLQPEAPFVSKELHRDMDELQLRYGELAYIDAEVSPRTVIAEEPGYIHLLYEIKEGEKAYLEKIRIVREPFDKTKDRVFLNRLRIYPGEPLDLRRMRKSLDRLRATGYFEDVTFRTEPGSAPNRRELVIEAVEGSTGSFRFGAGYSSNFGILGTLELSQRNFDLFRFPTSISDFLEGRAFAGAGQTLQITVQPGQTVNRFSISWREPFILDMDVGLGVNLYSVSTDRSYYKEQRRGANVTVDKRWDTGWEVGFRVRYQDILITNVEAFASEALREVEGSNTLLSFTPMVSYDTRDSVLTPSEGILLGASFETAGGILGGGFNFNKFQANADLFYPVLETRSGAKHVVSLHGGVGWVEEFGESTEVPIFERFFLGGAGSIRGFRYRTISPRDHGDPIGGNFMIAGSAEYTFPIFRTEVRDREVDIVRGAVFLDTGCVSTDVAGFKTGDFRVSAGIGIRFRVPQLGPVPIALDLGFPLRKLDDDELQAFHLNLGANF